MKQQLKDFIQKNCIRKGDFELSAGGESDIYFDLKRATLNGDFLYWLQRYFQVYILPKFLDVNILAGHSVGADFIVASLINSHNIKTRERLQGSIVRKPKDHGTQSVIENQLTVKIRNTLVWDDVITTGKSVGVAAETLLKDGYAINGICAIVNRGGDKVKSELSDRFKCPIVSIFEGEDFI
jgi:orotate phosphoribosyltransferase